MFEIVKDRPIPAAVLNGKNRKAVYPFRGMSVGDSFDVPAEKVQSARACAPRMQRKMNAKFAVVKQPDGSAIVWRIK